jgi:hypothetical protein
MSNVPPAIISSPLIIILPPVPAAIPNLPELKLKGVGLFRLIVKKSADKTLPAVVKSSGTAALSFNELAELFVAKEIADVPERIFMAPIV